MRKNEFFTRNAFTTVGRFEIPLVEKQIINLDDVALIAYSNTKNNDSEENRKRAFIFLLMITNSKVYTKIQNIHLAGYLNTVFY